MTSFPAAEATSFHRGKTITPESPRPLHIPEPSNIPVLQNQIDPIFNLMSTHMEPPYALRDLTAMDHDLAHHPATDQLMSMPDDDDRNGFEVAHVTNTRDEVNGGSTRGTEDSAFSLGMEGIQTEQRQSETSLNEIQTLLADQHSASMASFDQLSPQAISQAEQAPSSQPHTMAASYHVANPFESSQDYLMLDTPGAQRNKSAPQEEVETTGENHTRGVANEEVDIQALLDNMPQSGSPTPAADSASTINIAMAEPSGESSSTNAPSATFPIPAGLPPRPPPQEKPAIHPNYVPGEDIRSYHFPQMSHASQPSQPSNSYRPTQNYQHPLTGPSAPTGPGANGLPPPPMASFQQPSKNHPPKRNSPVNQPPRASDHTGRIGPKAVSSADGYDDDISWGPEVQRKYEEFLDDERIYTAEGTWDKFPPGSRLFVGNLPSEVASKRDIFNIFHKYGRLAQIAIKQAYGFVQFLDANSCYAALHSEQGGRLKDRNMHLEISKPPKNSRNATSSAAGDSLRASYYRRSRSPDYGRRPPTHTLGGPRPGADRFSDFRDETRRRDDYRPGRSPSPRGYRGRDEYRNNRDRSPDRYYSGRSRSRSPYGRGPARFNRSPSPRRRSMDDDDALPLPRRDARDVPDVQLLLMDDLDRSFVAYIEKSFIDRGLRCAALTLPNVSLAAVIKRQILEGVQAVVKLFRASQLTGKIPISVFDRSGGAEEEVSFDEYEELDVKIAAELVVRNKAAQAASLAASRPQYPGPGPSYGVPQYGQPQHQPQLQLQPQQSAGPTEQPNLANLITSLDGPALQKLLGAMQQNPGISPISQQHIPQHPPTQTQDLSVLLSGGHHATPQQGAMPQSYSYPAPQQAQAQPIQQFPYNAPYQQPLQQAAPPQYQQQHNGQQQVQSIMEQLAKWKQ